MLTSQLHIIIVRDDESDGSLLRDAIAQQTADLQVQVEPLHDAQQALSKIRAVDPRPNMLLLDVSFRGPSGWKFLTGLRADRQLGTLPVFVVTDSEDTADIERADKHNVVGFIPRPSSSQEYLDTAKTLLAYWSIMQHPKVAA